MNAFAPVVNCGTVLARPPSLKILLALRRLCEVLQARMLELNGPLSNLDLRLDELCPRPGELVEDCLSIFEKPEKGADILNTMESGQVHKAKARLAYRIDELSNERRLRF